MHRHGAFAGDHQLHEPRSLSMRVCRSAMASVWKRCLNSGTSAPSTATRYVQSVMRPQFCALSPIFRTCVPCRRLAHGTGQPVYVCASIQCSESPCVLFRSPTQCWCAESLPSYVTFHHDGCTSTCTGYPEETCGKFESSNGRCWFFPPKKRGL